MTLRGLALLGGLYAALYAFWFLGTPLGQFPQLDGAENIALATQIAQGTLPAEPFYRAMLYPAILSLPLWLGLDGQMLPFWAGLLGILAHAANGVFIGIIARRLWPENPWWWLAGVTYALYPVAVWFAAEPFDTTVALTAALASLTALATKHPGWQTGLTAGIAVLLRPHYLPLLLVLPVLQLIRQTGKPRWGACLSTAGAGAACLLAFGLVNVQVGGEFRLLPSQGIFNFYAANGPDANGRYFVQKLVIGERDAQTNPTRLEAQRRYAQATGAEPPFDDVAVNAYWQQAWQAYMAEAWPTWLGLMAQKVYFLGNDHESYNNKTYGFHRARTPMLAWNPLGWGVLFVLALGLSITALLEARRRPNTVGLFDHRLALALLGAGAALAGGIVLFYVSARFRLPLAPFLCLTLPALWLLRERWRALRWPSLLPLALAGLLGGLWTYSNAFDLRNRATWVQDELLLANAAAEAGTFPEALNWLQQADARAPMRPDIARQGLMLWVAQLIAAQLEAFADALPLEVQPVSMDTLRRWSAQMSLHDAEVAFAQGLLAWRAGDVTQARDYWEQGAASTSATSHFSQLALAWLDDRQLTAQNPLDQAILSVLHEPKVSP